MRKQSRPAPARYSDHPRPPTPAAPPPPSRLHPRLAPPPPLPPPRPQQQKGSGTARRIAGPPASAACRCRAGMRRRERLPGSAAGPLAARREALTTGGPALTARRRRWAVRWLRPTCGNARGAGRGGAGRGGAGGGQRPLISCPIDPSTTRTSHTDTPLPNLHTTPTCMQPPSSHTSVTLPLRPPPPPTLSASYRPQLT